MRKNTSVIIITCTLLGLMGCQGATKHRDSSENLTDSLWCNQRYLTNNDSQFDDIHLNVAKETYIYAIASSIAISNSNIEIKKSHPNKLHGIENVFVSPARMQQKDVVYDSKTGFSATTFWLYEEDGSNKPDELIIAFSGSNEVKDWWANLTPFGLKHYKKARLYFEEMVSKYDDENRLKVVVTGYSLGGGISLNVLKNKDTRDLVDKAVIFNSSTKSYSWDVRRDSKLWAASTKYEGMKLFRRFMRFLGASIAPDTQRAEGYNLSQKNLIEDHYNDVLTRSLLHVADYAMITEGVDETEPMKLLQLTEHSECSI